MSAISEAVSRVVDRRSILPIRFSHDLVRMDLLANSNYPQELGLKRIIAADWLVDHGSDPTSLRQFFYGSYSFSQRRNVKDAMNAGHLHPQRAVRYVTAGKAHSVREPRIVPNERLRGLFADTRGVAIELVLDFINVAAGANQNLPPEDRKKPFSPTNRKRVEAFFTEPELQEQRELLHLILSHVIRFIASDDFKPHLERRKNLLVKIHHGSMTIVEQKEYNEISDVIRQGIQSSTMTAWETFAKSYNYNPAHHVSREAIASFSQTSLIRYIN